MELKEKLKACSKLCHITLKGGDKIKSPNATKLLLGIREEEFINPKLKNENLLVYDGFWTATLENLLSLKETKKKFQNVYNDPKKSLSDLITGKYNDDYLSNTPLEIAYRWSITNYSLVTGLLRLHAKKFV